MVPVGSSVMLELILALYSYHVTAYPDLIIWKNLSLKYFPNFPPVKMQLRSLIRNNQLLIDIKFFQKVMRLHQSILLLSINGAIKLFGLIN